MRKLFLFLTISLVALAPVVARAQQAAPAQQRLIGEVTAVDAAAHTVSVRADSGETVTLSTTEQTTYTRLAAGVTDLKQGERVTFAEVRVGDRVLAPGVSAGGGTAARLILMTRPGGTAAGGQNAGRRLNGRVVSVDAAKKLIVVQARGREGQESVTVSLTDSARVLHYAPDSMRPADAVAVSLADVRAGDNIRATGERSADGATFKAEEVLAGAFARFAGTVTAVDAQRNELTVKNEQTGATVKLSLGARSTLRRMTPEFEQAMAKQRAEFEQRRAERRAERQQQGGQPQGSGGQPQGQGGQTAQGEGGRPRRGEGQGRGDGNNGNGQRRGGFGGPGGGGAGGQMFDSLPTVAVADLKKGDAIVVTVTPNAADASHATVVSLVTGTPETIRGMQQFQRGGDGQRGMSPGLPGDVIGGGQGPTREPPR